MHKDRIAESLLALVTPRERAASTVGDLQESATTRGNLWFWSSVLRTGAAQLWHTFVADPTDLLAKAFRGWLLFIGFAVLSQLCVVAATFGVLAIVYTALDPGQPLNWNHVFQSWAIRGTYYSLLFGIPVLFAFQVGRWVARRVAGREVIVSLVLIAMQCLLWVVSAAMVTTLDAYGIKPPLGNWSLPPDVIPFAIVSNVMSPLASLAGAVWVRRRAVAR